MSALSRSVDPEALAELVPPATLSEARAFRDDLSRLLRRERTAAADFGRRRGWERLGHANLFAFLVRELGLSKGAAWVRLSAARLLPRFPEVEAALREGTPCLSAVGELSRVLTEENRAAVLPRFLGCSSREAREVAAALAPREDPPGRDVVTAVAGAAVTPVSAKAEVAPTPGLFSAPVEPMGAEVRAHEPAPTHPPRAAPRDEAEPLDAEHRRLHVTVSRRLLAKIDRARVGLSHALPGATTEQVLERALDLLLEQQARSKALVKRPRATATATASPTSTPTPTPTPTSKEVRPHVPAAVEREVRLREADRCRFPLDSGDLCGSTWQVELDHLVPLALGGETTPSNLRGVCAFHNRLAARRELGPRASERRRAGG